MASKEEEDMFQDFIAQMKHHLTGENIDDIIKAIKCAKKALAIRDSEKLKKRIKKMEDFVAEHGSDEDDDDDDDDMVDLGQGLFLSNEIVNKLYDYQKEGLRWLFRLFLKKKGGILGDDMGLGKTVQITTFLSAMFDLQKIKTVLIVLPVTLIPNWEREIDRWGPNLSVYNYHSATKRGRERLIEKVQRRGGVVLLTYGILISNWEQLGTDLLCYGRSFVWDYVILDEGHKIKNPTKATKGAHAIPARNRIVVTGTPIQNNLQELWSLFNFVHQGTLLGTLRTFQMQYEGPITRSRQRDASAAEKRLGTEMAEMLRKRIAPYFLRRTKAEVMSNKENDDGSLRPDELKRKNDFVIWTCLSPKQIKLYKDFATSEEVQEVLMSSRSPLVQLNIMKKICDHPRLLSAGACHALGLDDSQRQMVIGEGVDYGHVSDEELIRESGKMSFLIELLKDFNREGHRCLVFSQSRKVLDMIQRIMKNLGIYLMRIDGTVSKGSERQDMIDKFNSNPKYTVFLLTTQVGGVGLSITAANRVVIYDPSWNPATDSQAVDRCYRIGQKKSVIVYRLITCGTIEEKIYRRQIFKQSLHKQTTDGAQNPFRYFSKQEIYDMFLLDDTTHSKTQVQLEKMHSANRITDETLDAHIAKLYSYDIFGISDHDLMFSVNQADEEVNQMEKDHIFEKVTRAEKLVQMECDLNEQASEGKATMPSGPSASLRSNSTKNVPITKSTSTKTNVPITPKPVKKSISSNESLDLMDVSLGIQNMTVVDDEEPSFESENKDHKGAIAIVIDETPDKSKTKSLNSTSSPVVISDSEGNNSESETDVTATSHSLLKTSSSIYDKNTSIEGDGPSVVSETSTEDEYYLPAVEMNSASSFLESSTANTTIEMGKGDVSKETARKLRRSSMFFHLVNKVEDESEDSDNSFVASSDETDSNDHETMSETSTVASTKKYRRIQVIESDSD